MITSVKLHTAVANVEPQPPVLPTVHIEAIHMSLQDSSMNTEDNKARTYPSHHSVYTTQWAIIYTATRTNANHELHTTNANFQL